MDFTFNIYVISQELKQSIANLLENLIARVNGWNGQASHHKVTTKRY